MTLVDRRQFLASFGIVCGIAASARNGNAQQRTTLAQAMPGMSPGTMTAQDCIESCWRSHVMCLEAERYCLEKGGTHVMPKQMVGFVLATTRGPDIGGDD